MVAGCGDEWRGLGDDRHQLVQQIRRTEERPMIVRIMVIADAWTRTTRTRLHTRGFMVVFDVDDHGSEVVALMGIGRAGTTIASDI